MEKRRPEKGDRKAEQGWMVDHSAVGPRYIVAEGIRKLKVFVLIFMIPMVQSI
ncbi:MAG TPA: hypothetical protein VFG54_00820 [Prolixibacteraceae bacterium]|nr:hypothetical protein [Prolixibacteraceae bacterium]